MKVNYNPIHNHLDEELGNLAKLSPQKQSKKSRLDLINVCYSIPFKNSDKVLLRNISFTLHSGELCALMGPSGAGKR
jgi:ABC-type multidrug transport system ATPase subunit